MTLTPHCPQETDHAHLKSTNSRVNCIIDQLVLAGNFRIFQPITMKYTFFSEAYEPLSKIGRLLGHEVCLNKCKRICIVLAP